MRTSFDRKMTSLQITFQNPRFWAGAWSVGRYRNKKWMIHTYKCKMFGWAPMSEKDFALGTSLLEAGEKCRICKGSRHLGRDHNHVSGEFRGILCDRCNLCIDWFVKNHINAKQYLEETKQL